MDLKLVPGHFYRSKDNHVWCCYNIRIDEAVHCQAYCVRLSDSRVGYFYLDGRYDPKGAREHSLLKEVIFAEHDICVGNCNCEAYKIEF
jgi:hypothetical protein